MQIILPLREDECFTEVCALPDIFPHIYSQKHMRTYHMQVFHTILRFTINKGTSVHNTESLKKSSVVYLENVLDCC